MYRIVVRIVHINKRFQNPVITACIPGWNPHRFVRFRASLIPQKIRDALKPGTRLFVQVNLRARKYGGLSFDNFELAPAKSNTFGGSI
jgi:hypothetical protein